MTKKDGGWSLLSDDDLVDIINAETAKAALQSKTLWFNLVMLLLTLLESNVHLLASYFTPGTYLVVIMLVNAVNFWLRTVTRSPVRFK